MDQKSRENFLIQIMTKGLERASASFARLIGRSVHLVDIDFLMIRSFDNASVEAEKNGVVSVLVTQLIGEISGKSYLILNRQEKDQLFSLVPPAIRNSELSNAFLLEIDNIISASVIAELSNALEVEIYGDVPYMEDVPVTDLNRFIHSGDSPQEPSSVIFCNAAFQFDVQERINPQYIWKLNRKIFDLIPVV